MEKRETAEIYLEGPFLGISLPEGTRSRMPCGFSIFSYRQGR